LLLEDHGCHIAGRANTINAALQVIHSQPVDCVMLDMNLNGEMTFALADVLDESNIPFLLVTGHEQDRLPQRFRKHPLVVKPYTHTQVIDALTQLITD